VEQNDVDVAVEESFCDSMTVGQAEPCVAESYSSSRGSCKASVNVQVSNLKLDRTHSSAQHPLLGQALWVLATDDLQGLSSSRALRDSETS
jgi:hypothetical protein